MKRGSGISCGGTYRGFLLECEGIATSNSALRLWRAIVGQLRQPFAAQQRQRFRSASFLLSGWERTSVMSRKRKLPSYAPNPGPFLPQRQNARHKVREWTTITTTNYAMPVNVEVRL